MHRSPAGIYPSVLAAAGPGAGAPRPRPRKDLICRNNPAAADPYPVDKSSPKREPQVRTALILAVAALSACSSLLPRAQSLTYAPWTSFEQAQHTFDGIVPHETTLQQLRDMQLDPKANPNITILNYSDILRRFLPSPSINAHDLDPGVQECIAAKSGCEGYEINQQTMKRKRYGSFLADLLNFRRKTDISGFRFNGVLLIKDRVVIYKLTGGQPAIHEFEESVNPLGPFQSGAAVTAILQ